MTSYPHFENKDALTHVAEKKEESRLLFSEAHGKELPGALRLGTDSVRDTSLLLLLISLIAPQLSLIVLFLFICAWSVWRGGRSGFFAWSRLEKLHQLIEQEKKEITENKPQEREELNALYRAKGLQEPLLTQVVDVLMSDDDLLLKVMLEEEMGISLKVHESPFRQAVAASAGAFLSGFLCLTASFYFPFGLQAAGFILIAFSTLTASIYEKTNKISSLVWSLGLSSMAYGILYYLLLVLSS